MSEPLHPSEIIPQCSNKSESYSLTKREFLNLCGIGFCALSVDHLFPKASRAQASRKGLVRTKLSPYFTPLEGRERSSVSSVRNGARLEKGRGVFAGSVRTGTENTTAWFTGIPVPFISIQSRRSLSSMSFRQRPLSRWQRRDVTSNASSARTGRSRRPLQRICTTMMSLRS